MKSETSQRPNLLRRVLAGMFRASRPPVPPEMPVSAPCACGKEHEVPPVLEALFGRARPSVEVSSREWYVAFADKVTPGNVINIPHSDVARLALRVLEVRRHEDGEFDGHAVTFLAVDVADASQPYSPTLSVHTGLRIAVSAPDSPAGLGGTA